MREEISMSTVRGAFGFACNFYLNIVTFVGCSLSLKYERLIDAALRLTKALRKANLVSQSFNRPITYSGDAF